MRKTIGYLFLALALSACSPVDFSATKNQAPTTPGVIPNTPGSCQPGTIESIYRMTKILFVVDTSGSNAATTYNYCGPTGGTCADPATDPTKQFRGGALNSFLTTYRHKTNFQWGFLTFAADTAKALINSGTVYNPIFAPNPNVMQSALNTFLTMPDDGNTPYHAALDMAARAIAADPDLRSPAKPDYFVVLLTDGFPTDYYDSSGNFRSVAMQSDIQALVNLAPDQVSLSTIYYSHNPDQHASALLQQMAGLGGGQFASVTPTGVDFKIDDVIPPQKVPGCN